MTQHFIYVCTSCSLSRSERDCQGIRGGQHLFNLLKQQSDKLHPQFTIQPVQCMSACNRFCAIAFAAPHKTTLMFGDIPALESATAVLTFAEQYRHSPDGLVPHKQRPVVFQKGILARIPPLPS